MPDNRTGRTGNSAEDREELHARLSHPAFTPGRREIPAVAGLVADPEWGEKASLALSRTPRAALPVVAKLVNEATNVHPALVRTLGSLLDPEKISPEDLVLGRDALIRVTELPTPPLDPRAVRYAARALGRLPGAASVQALARLLFERGPDLSCRKVVVEALGKLGDANIAERLAAELSWSGADALYTRLVDEALVRLRRDAQRSAAPGRVRGDAAVTELRVEWRCRTGLEDLLRDEIAERVRNVRPGSDAKIQIRNLKVDGPGRVNARWTGSFGGILSVTRIASDFVLPVGLARGLTAKEFAVVMDKTVCQRMIDLVEGTDSPAGRARYVIRFASGRPRRGLLRELAVTLDQAFPKLMNDARGPHWEIAIDDRAVGDAEGDAARMSCAVALRPVGLSDERFAWRSEMVAASSHAPLAAAIARLGGVEKEDIVWDPFCGAGVELIERALLGPAARMLGTDLDRGAVAAAQGNIERSVPGRIQIEHGDGLQQRLKGVTLVLTNPPLGKRVARGEEGKLLADFARKLPEHLAPKARVVIVVPKTRDLGEFGIPCMRKDLQCVVDLGGFDALLQRWVR